MRLFLTIFVASGAIEYIFKILKVSTMASVGELLPSLAELNELDESYRPVIKIVDFGFKKKFFKYYLL